LNKINVRSAGATSRLSRSPWFTFRRGGDALVVCGVFTRQLNEIDATFKHAYIENPQFGIAEMRDTVRGSTAPLAERSISPLNDSARSGPERPVRSSAMIPRRQSLVEGVGALAS
jgi:hypothetical protein